MLLSSVDIDSYLKEAKDGLESAKSDNKLFEEIVNAPFRNRRFTTTLGLGFITFLLNNKLTGKIDRITKTDNELGRLGSATSVKPFKAIKIPLDYRGNIIAEAIRTGRYQQTSDWWYLLAPDLDSKEAQLNQAKAGIACSYVYPVQGRDGAALIFHYFITMDKITLEQRNLMYRYAKMVGLALNKTKVN